MIDNRVFLLSEMLDFTLKDCRELGGDNIKSWLISQMEALDTMSDTTIEAGVKLFKQHPAICKKIWAMSINKLTT